jgi:hypothetical protein
MKNRIMHVIVTTAIALAVTGIARADSDDKKVKECSEATLQGLYVFSATGFSIVAGVAQPRALAEFIRFNGDGTLSNPAVTLSINGVITRGGGPGQAGTYSIASNCTGSLAFGPPGPTFDLFVSPSGSEVHMIFTGGPVPGLGVVPGVLQGVAERVSR